MLGLMLQGGIFDFGNLLTQLENLGFFRIVLPFLLIFAVVYAVLTKIPVFEKNRGAGAFVAFAVGLLALQFDQVPAFFQVVFPNFGIALSLLLIALILAGAFISDEEKKYKWIFFGLGAIMFLVVTFTSFSDWQFTGYWWWQQYGGLIITGIIVIGAIVAVVVGGKPRT